MDREIWMQCQSCGKLHKIRIQYNIEDVYIKLHCPECRDQTHHLICTEDEREIYEFYNVCADPRYYIYNTK